MSERDGLYCVYVHQNKLNGKRYVGMTKDITRRWHGGGVEYIRGDRLFGNAIIKYGWDGFRHSILHDNLLYKDACVLEKHYIKLFQTNATKYQNPSYGYNLTDGGENICGNIRRGKDNPFYGKHHTLESRRLMSQARIGKNIGADNPNYGVTKPEDTKRAISQSLKDWYKTHNSPHNKSVLCVTDGRTFNSVKEAALYYGISNRGISACCTGRNKTTNGMMFTYSTDGAIAWRQKEDGRTTPEFRSRLRDVHSKPVICVETGVLFPSCHEAAIALGKPNGKSSVAKCCKNGKAAWGYHWRYQNNEAG